MVIRVYWASVTCNRKVDGDQTRLRYLIESLKLESEWVDVTTDAIILKRMREECDNPNALPPQIFNEDVYLGDMDAMNQSVEEERLMEWLNNKTSTTVHLPLEVSQIPSEKPVQAVTHTSTVVTVNSATKNIRPETSVKTEEKVVISKPTSPIVVNKSVSNAIDAFEDKQRSPPPVQRQAVKIQFANKNNNNDNIENGGPKIDEERRRRILGLPPTEGEELNCLQDKTNDAFITNGATTKMISEFKTFQGVKVTASSTAED